MVSFLTPSYYEMPTYLSSNGWQRLSKSQLAFAIDFADAGFKINACIANWRVFNTYPVGKTTSLFSCEWLEVCTHGIKNGGSVHGSEENPRRIYIVRLDSEF